jgi:hypothetical protein
MSTAVHHIRQEVRNAEIVTIVRVAGAAVIKASIVRVARGVGGVRIVIVVRIARVARARANAWICLNGNRACRAGFSLTSEDVMVMSRWPRNHAVI